MDRVAVHRAVDLVLDHMEQGTANTMIAADEIVPVTRQAIEAEELDYAPALRAAQSGKLRTVWQGRRRLTTRRWLVEYVMQLPAASIVEPTDDLMIAARKRAARRVA